MKRASREEQLAAKERKEKGVMQNWTEADWVEWHRERAAIMEFDGGLSYAEAQRRAGDQMALLKLECACVRKQARARGQAKALGATVGPGPVQMELIVDRGQGTAKRFYHRDTEARRR